jgi:DUF4097 and DUF4098 domain-containing protein YvlB
VQGGTPLALSPESQYELWVPRQTTVRFSLPVGDLTLRDFDGDIIGNTKLGALTAENVRGKASFSTDNGDVRILNSQLTGAIRTGCGATTQSPVTKGLELTTAFNTAGLPDFYRGPYTPMIIIDGVVANEYCVMKARGAVDASDRADENYPYGDIVRDSVLKGGSLSTRSGSVRIGVARRYVTATTSRGNVDIAHLQGDATMLASGGNVTARVENYDSPAHSINARALNGNVTIEVPADLDAVIDIESAYTAEFETRMKRSANIDSDISLTRSETSEWDAKAGKVAYKYVRGTTTAGNGSGRILIRAIDGDITLKRVK